MGRGVGQKLKQAAAASSGGSGAQAGAADPSNMSPKQLRQQAKMMRKMGPSQLRQRNPQFRGASDTDIEQSINHIEKMAEDPEYRKSARENANMISPQDRELARKDPSDMTPQEFSRLMKMQRDLLRKNPQQFHRQMQNNPMTAGLTTAQLEAQINQMADMDADELHTYMTMSKTMEPVTKAFKNFDDKTYGYGRYLILVILLVVVFYIGKLVIGFVASYAVPVVTGAYRKYISGEEVVEVGLD